MLSTDYLIKPYIINTYINPMKYLFLLHPVYRLETQGLDKVPLVIFT